LHRSTDNSGSREKQQEQQTSTAEVVVVGICIERKEKKIEMVVPVSSIVIIKLGASTHEPKTHPPGLVR